MKVIFDSESDTLSIILREDKIYESDEIKEGLIFDYNENGKLISIEILDASEQVAEPQGIMYELKQLKEQPA